MREANTNFVAKDFNAAVEGYLNVIKLAPNTHEAYSTLSIIHKEMGNSIKSFNYALIALHLSETESADGSSWSQLAYEALALSLSTEAIYCFNRAIRRNWKDVQSIWMRLLLFHERRERRKIADSCTLLLKNVSYQPLIIRLLIHVHLVLNEPLRLIGILESMLLTSPTQTSMSRWTFYHLRFLCRLYVHLGDYQRLFNALPGIVLWMRKVFSNFPLDDNNDIIQLTIKEGPFVGTLFSDLNSLCSPFDLIFYPIINDLPISNEASTLNNLNILTYPSDVTSNEDRALRPIDFNRENDSLITSDPLKYVDSWFNMMPIDIQAYFLLSSIYCKQNNTFEVRHLRGNLLDLMGYF